MVGITDKQRSSSDSLDPFVAQVWLEERKGCAKSTCSVSALVVLYLCLRFALDCMFVP